jgi:hypothetical protein
MWTKASPRADIRMGLIKKLKETIYAPVITMEKVR